MVLVSSVRLRAIEAERIGGVGAVEGVGGVGVIAEQKYGFAARLFTFGVFRSALKTGSPDGLVAFG